MTHFEDPVALMQEHDVKPTANRILILKALLQAGRPLSMAEIETAITPTAAVKDILTPLYNFKAGSTAAIDEETRDGED